MAEERYQGHANWATWSVCLYIDNESNECIHEAWEASKGTAKDMREWFEGYFLSDLNEGRHGNFNVVACHFLNGAMEDVNWEEVRQGYYDEAKENGAIEEEEDEDEEQAEEDTGSATEG